MGCIYYVYCIRVYQGVSESQAPIGCVLFSKSAPQVMNRSTAPPGFRSAACNMNRDERGQGWVVIFSTCFPPTITNQMQMPSFWDALNQIWQWKKKELWIKFDYEIKRPRELNQIWLWNKKTELWIKFDYEIKNRALNQIWLWNKKTQRVESNLTMK